MTCKRPWQLPMAGGVRGSRAGAQATRGAGQENTKTACPGSASSLESGGRRANEGRTSRQRSRVRLEAQGVPRPSKGCAKQERPASAGWRAACRMQASGSIMAMKPTCLRVRWGEGWGAGTGGWGGGGVVWCVCVVCDLRLTDS